MNDQRPTFGELFCLRYQVSPERYIRAVFWRCLHWHAYLVAPLVAWLNPAYFAGDYEMIERSRPLRSAHEVFEEIDEYQLNPWNAGFWHRVLRVRVSGNRFASLVCRVMRPRR